MTPTTGTLNGSNRIFTIPENIVAGTEEVIVNGQVITRGVDYTHHHPCHRRLYTGFRRYYQS